MKLRDWALATVIGLSCAATTSAGIYTDDLSRCFVESTSPEDKTDLVKWMFMAMSQHPSVSGLSSVTPNDLDEANKKTADLLVHLLTGSCLQKAKEAIRIEGAGAIQVSFGVLGQVAAANIFSDPNVAKSIAGIEKYVDKTKLEELAKTSASK